MKLFQSAKDFISRIITDRLATEAAALTYQSFLAIVPFFAVLFGIAKGFGLEEILEEWLRRQLTDQQEILGYILDFSQQALQTARGGVIAGIGILFFIFTAIKLLSSMETAFNMMWGGVRGRRWTRMVSDYLALILVCPFLLAISSSLSFYVSSKLLAYSESVGELVRPAFVMGIRTLSYATTAALFAIVLYAMPCAPVRLSAALLSGILAAFCFQILQSWYVFLQFHFTRLGTIYGSFVALPLFLIWLWLSWLLLLIAGELTVFIQEKTRCIKKRTLFSELEIEARLLAFIQAKWEEGQKISLKELFTLKIAPIRDIMAAIARLERKGFVHNGGYEVLPVHTERPATLADIILPDIKTEKGKIAEAITAWKEELVSNPRNVSVRDVGAGCPHALA